MNDAPAPLVTARGLHKSYAVGKGTLEVLRGIDMSVNRGEFLALRGASGAGKSTLLHLLGGLDLPNSGEIRFDGTDLRAYHLLPELSALENVALPARLARIAPHESARRATALLERVGLGKRMEHRPYELSGGEQQRVAIARALVNQPDLILADEPTGNLDSHTGGEIIQLLEALRAERQATFIMATHDAHIAGRAQRVIELADGQLAA